MKPLYISEEEKQNLLKEFTEYINTTAFTGEFSFSKTYTYKNENKIKAKVIYTPGAYVKTITLLSKFSTEVAWHVLVHRGDNPNEFIVYDVLVYPQKVTGATVQTDDEDYTKFMIDLTDEQAEYMHGQCHSHVNMGVTPSGTDLSHQERLLKMLNNQGFYLFQIWNKSLSVNTYIYDYDNNVKYDPEDVDVEVVDDEGVLMSDFTKEAKDLVVNTPVTKPVQTGWGSSYGSNYGGNYGSNYGGSWNSGYNDSYDAVYGKEKKKDVKSAAGGKNKDDIDEDDLDTEKFLLNWARNNPYYYNDFQGVW